MGGGGLAFLNKKTWHPGRLDNQEEKWKREQAAAKEKAKLDELQKQIVLERQQEELHAVAQAAGVKEWATLPCTALPARVLDTSCLVSGAVERVGEFHRLTSCSVAQRTYKGGRCGRGMTCKELAAGCKIPVGS